MNQHWFAGGLEWAAQPGDNWLQGKRGNGVAMPRRGWGKITVGFVVLGIGAVVWVAAVEGYSTLPTPYALGIGAAAMLIALVLVAMGLRDRRPGTRSVPGSSVVVYLPTDETPETPAPVLPGKVEQPLVPEAICLPDPAVERAENTEELCRGAVDDLLLAWEADFVAPTAAVDPGDDPFAPAPTQEIPKDAVQALLQASCGEPVPTSPNTPPPKRRAEDVYQDLAAEMERLRKSLKIEE